MRVVRGALQVFLKTLAVATIAISSVARAADVPYKPASSQSCMWNSDPYQNYQCLDAYLGEDFFTRFLNYYLLEWGKDSAPPDPKAPTSSRADWPKTPMTTPPLPFTEWPYGGSTSIGVTRPNSVDSPLMAALSNTDFGKSLNDAHIQIYGWLNGGGNISTNTVKPGGNWPAAYMYTPNTFQLDQAVLYVERLPDTGPYRLGLPVLGSLRRKLSLHHVLRPGELSASRAQSQQWLRLPDGVW